MVETRIGNGRSSLKVLVKNSGLYSVGNVAIKAIGFFLIPLYTRVMSPEDYGIIGFTTALGQIISPVISLGLISSMPILYYSYDPDERNRLISTVFNFSIVYSLVVTLAILIAWGSIFSHFAAKVSFNPYIILCVVTVFFSGFYWLPLGIFNMEERAAAYSIYSVSLSLLGVLLTIVMVLLLSLKAFGVLLAGAIASSIGMISVFIIIRKIYKPILDKDKLKDILVISLPVLPHLFSITLWQATDRLFLANMASLATTGIYSIAMTIASVILIILGGATTALNPLFFKRAYQHDPTLPSDWARLFTLFFFGAVWLGLSFTILAPELITILTPSKYHEAIPLLRILVIGQVILGMYWILSPGIGFCKKTWVYAVASFPALGINLLLNFLLVPKYGAIGAAWVMIITTATQCLIFGFFSLKYYPFPLNYIKLLKVIILGVTLFVLSQWLSFLPLLLGFVTKILLLMLLPLGLLIWGFFCKDDIDAAMSFIIKTWKKITAGSF